MAPVVRKEKRSGTASFLNRLDQCSLPAGYKLQFTQAVGMEKLDFYLVGNDPQPVQLELSRTDAPKSTKLSLEGGRVAMTLTYKGKNEKTNAHDVDYEVEYGVTEKARWGGAFGAFARKAGASAWKYLPHVLVVAAGVAIATLGLMSDFLKDTLKAGFYPTVGAVFVAIEAFAITSILARTKELREQRE
jgi:hypothetical protein